MLQYFISFLRRILNYILYEHPSFAIEGKNCVIGKNGIFTLPSMIELGNNVSIGPNAVIYAYYRKLKLLDNVLIGPNVTIVTGDHSIRRIGIPLIDNKEKLPEDDAEITIEEEVWIGANVTILKGVTVGRGSVIAAGCVIIKDVPPYTIYGGVPGKVLKNRFSLEEVIMHEKKIYPKEKRLDENELGHLK